MTGEFIYANTFAAKPRLVEIELLTSVNDSGLNEVASDGLWSLESKVWSGGSGSHELCSVASKTATSTITSRKSRRDRAETGLEELGEKRCFN